MEVTLLRLLSSKYQLSNIVFQSETRGYDCSWHVWRASHDTRNVLINRVWILKVFAQLFLVICCPPFAYRRIPYNRMCSNYLFFFCHFAAKSLSFSSWAFHKTWHKLPVRARSIVFSCTSDGTWAMLLRITIICICCVDILLCRKSANINFI